MLGYQAIACACSALPPFESRVDAEILDMSKGQTETMPKNTNLYFAIGRLEGLNLELGALDTPILD